MALSLLVTRSANRKDDRTSELSKRLLSDSINQLNDATLALLQKPLALQE